MNAKHNLSIHTSKPTKKVESVIQILKAQYGVPGIKMIEVATVEMGKKVNNHLVGSDPVPGKKKVMIIDLMNNGKKFTVEFKEGEVISF